VESCSACFRKRRKALNLLGFFPPQTAAQAVPTQATPCDQQARSTTENPCLSPELFQFALDVSKMGIWELCLDDHTVRRTLGHDRIFGYETLLPAWSYEIFLEHVLPEDGEMVDSCFESAVETLSGWSFECRIRRADGELRWIWAAGRHRQSDAGVRLMAEIVQDITERREIEEAIRISEEALRDSNRRKDEFLATLAHELRNPLAPIRSAVYVLGRLDKGRIRVQRPESTRGKCVAADCLLPLRASGAGQLRHPSSICGGPRRNPPMAGVFAPQSVGHLGQRPGQPVDGGVYLAALLRIFVNICASLTGSPSTMRGSGQMAKRILCRCARM
jgi:PAS domain S-box-containing protein